VSTYDLIRRRLAPVAFGLAIAFMAYTTCNKQERTTATFVIEYGAAERNVHAVDAEVWMNGEQVTQFRRVASEGAYIGTTTFKGSLPDTDGELRMDVELVSGEHRSVTRAIHVAEGSTVTVQIERDLR
jgi:hypothetical protein